MIEITRLEGMEAGDILQRSGMTRPDEEVERAVAAILEDVRGRGDAAVLEYEEKFDKVRLDGLAVSGAEIDAAFAAMDGDFIETLQAAAANIEAFHRRQVRTGFVLDETDGAVLGQRVMPLARVGLYVPGGTARYPSTVLMDAIPARIAGVGEIAMATPPGPDGKVPAVILAAAKVAGVTAIYKMGGAQAVAAFAYGTDTVKPVDKIVGPGNIFVATAKRQVYGLVDIDMIAGPSEILVVADGGADPAHVAADLLSQAEHDKRAAAVLVCDSMDLARAVDGELERQTALLERADIARASLAANGRLIVTDDLARAIDVANALAPEHLELCVEDPFAWLHRVRNAGSVFLGHNTPEALGDYFAGPNHTLPTGGTARFSSPLGVDDFVKRSSFIYYSRGALAGVRRRVADFATREGLTAHARSVTIRFDGEGEA